MPRKAAVKEAAADAPVISVKGFDHNLQCRGFQFEVGKTYTVSGKIEVCNNGFHACENPFDIWSYYPVVNSDGKLTRYAEVEQSGAISRHGEDSKIASASITVKAEIFLPEFVKRAVQALIALTKDKDESGDYAQIGSSGYSAKIGSSGYSAKIGSSGDYAKIGSNGYSAKIGSSGDYAQIGSSGDYAKIGSSGDYAQIVAEGKDAVIASAGPGTTVSGADGAWISIAEFVDRKCVGFATGCIGKDGLLPGVAYKAQDGKLIPA